MSVRVVAQYLRKMVWVRVRLRDVLAPANKEGTDHAKEKQAPL